MVQLAQMTLCKNANTVLCATCHQRVWNVRDMHLLDGATLQDAPVVFSKRLLRAQQLCMLVGHNRRLSVRLVNIMTVKIM